MQREDQSAACAKPSVHSPVKGGWLKKRNGQSCKGKGHLGVLVKQESVESHESSRRDETMLSTAC
jgi:hypothetical protein